MRLWSIYRREELLDTVKALHQAITLRIVSNDYANPELARALPEEPFSRTSGSGAKRLHNDVELADTVRWLTLLYYSSLVGGHMDEHSLLHTERSHELAFIEYYARCRAANNDISPLDDDDARPPVSSFLSSRLDARIHGHSQDFGSRRGYGGRRIFENFQTNS